MDQLKKSSVYILTVVIFLCFIGSASGQIPRNISVAIKAGNSASLSDHFNENIELTILEKEGIYSRTQAEQIVKDFFAANNPKVFNLLHEGGKGSAHYAIGELTTDKGTYRVYFLIKMINNQSYINQLRIEKN